MSWQNYVREVDPYVAGYQPKQSNIIKLNTNENPYPPSPEVKKLLQNFSTERLRLYPNSDANQLQDALASSHGLKSEQVFIGNGSDEVLALAFLTFFNGKSPILFPEITYSFYEVYCKLYNIPYNKIKMNDDLTIDYKSMFQENNGIIFANPNAPTSLQMPLEIIEEIISRNKDSLVIIDEAYIDFGGTSCLPLLNKYDNILIIQTFSKSRALAGCRLGMAYGSVEMISKMQDVKNSFNSYPIDTISHLIGVASVKDDLYFKKNIQQVIKTRDYATNALKELGFVVLDSKTNFLFVSHQSMKAIDIYNYLVEKNIYVRHFSKAKIDNYLRISIGTDIEMTTLIEAITEYKNNG